MTLRRIGRHGLAAACFAVPATLFSIGALAEEGVIEEIVVTGSLSAVPLRMQPFPFR